MQTSSFFIGMLVGGLWMFAGFFIAHLIGEGRKINPKQRRIRPIFLEEHRQRINIEKSRGRF